MIGRDGIAVFVEHRLRGGRFTAKGFALAVLKAAAAPHAAILIALTVRPLIVAATTATAATATAKGACAATAVRTGTKPLFTHLHTRKRLRIIAR